MPSISSLFKISLLSLLLPVFCCFLNPLALQSFTLVYMHFIFSHLSSHILLCLLTQCRADSWHMGLAVFSVLPNMAWRMRGEWRKGKMSLVPLPQLGRTSGELCRSKHLQGACEHCQDTHTNRHTHTDMDIPNITHWHPLRLHICSHNLMYTQKEYP